MIPQYNKILCISVDICMLPNYVNSLCHVNDLLFVFASLHLSLCACVFHNIMESDQKI